MRHTYASHLLAAGVSIYYAQRQLGHASIQLTVDTYGKWLPPGQKGVVNVLDSPNVVTVVTPQGVKNDSSDPGVTGSGHKVVTPEWFSDDEAAQVLEKKSGPRRTRTFDPLIKRRLQGSSNRMRPHLTDRNVGNPVRHRCG